MAAAGIGHIGLIDFDDVDMSNLQRQVLFTEQDVGKPKVECAAAKLKELNQNIKIEKIKSAITEGNALDITGGYDVIIDASDNFLTRYVVNDASFIQHVPLVYGSMFRFEGQISVFNLNKDAPCYRCLFPVPPPQDMIPSCSAGGALGALAGMIGSLQAAECIKIILGQGEMMSGKLIILKINKSSNCKLCSQNHDKLNSEWYKFPEYKNVCKSVKRISDKELTSGIRDKELFQLIDVREKWELTEAGIIIASLFLPLSEIEKRANEVVGLLSHRGKNIFYCEDGSRSTYAISLIERQFGYNNLYSYEGIPINYFQIQKE